MDRRQSWWGLRSRMEGGTGDPFLVNGNGLEPRMSYISLIDVLNVACDFLYLLCVANSGRQVIGKRRASTDDLENCVTSHSARGYKHLHCPAV